MPDTDRDFYTVDEIGARIGISRSKAYELVRKGLFGTPVQIGGRRFIARATYEAWLKAQTRPALAVVSPDVKDSTGMNPRWLAQQKKKAATR